MNNKQVVAVGKDITLVSKGIRHSDYGNWVEQDQIGSTHFLAVTRIGAKYIYGRYVSYSEGERNLSYEDKVNSEDYLVFAGIRQDLRQAYDQRRKEREEYQTLLERTRRDIERKHQQCARDEIDEWEKMNPRPSPISLTEIAPLVCKEGSIC